MPPCESLALMLDLWTYEGLCEARHLQNVSLPVSGFSGMSKNKSFRDYGADSRILLSCEMIALCTLGERVVQRAIITSVKSSSIISGSKLRE